MEIFFLVDEGELPFLIEDADANVLDGVDVGLELLGMEMRDTLDVYGAGFFVLAALFSLLGEDTCPK